MAKAKSKTTKKVATKKNNSTVSRADHAHMLYLLSLCILAVAVVLILMNQNM